MWAPPAGDTLSFKLKMIHQRRYDTKRRLRGATEVKGARRWLTFSASERELRRRCFWRTQYKQRQHDVAGRALQHELSRGSRHRL